MNEKHMDDMSLVATLDSEMEVGRGVLNQMHHVVMNSVFENIFKRILWSQWETGLYPLHLKAHAGKG